MDLQRRVRYVDVQQGAARGRQRESRGGARSGHHGRTRLGNPMGNCAESAAPDRGRMGGRCGGGAPGSVVPATGPSYARLGALPISGSDHHRLRTRRAIVRTRRRCHRTYGRRPSCGRAEVETAFDTAYRGSMNCPIANGASPVLRTLISTAWAARIVFKMVEPTTGVEPVT